MKSIEALRQRARQLKRDALALFYAYRDPRLPWYARAFSFYVAARTFSPIDLIPDFIPVIGYLDDLILTPLGIAIALKMIPAEVMTDARIQAEEHLEQGKPVLWYYVVIVALVWGLLLFMIFRALWNVWQMRAG